MRHRTAIAAALAVAAVIAAAALVSSRRPGAAAVEVLPSSWTFVGCDPTGPFTVDAPAEPAAADARNRATGRVVDETGSPIAGARVTSAVEPASSTSPPPANAEGPASASDANGRFAVALEGGAPYHSILVEAPGFAPAAVASVRPGDDVVATLTAGCALEGRVLDACGDPVAGANIRWSQRIGACTSTRAAASAIDGAYRIDDLTACPPNRWPGSSDWGTIRVEAAGFPRLDVSASYAAPAGERRFALDLVLRRSGRIRGRVLDAETSEAIAGASVAFQWDQSSVESRSDAATSGADGRFELSNVPLGDFRFENAISTLVVDAPEHAHAEQRVPSPGENETSEVELRCPAVASIVGRLVDASGAPLPNEYLGVRIVEGRGASTRTGTDGRFRFDGLEARRDQDQPVEFRVNRWWDGPVLSTKATVRGGTTTDVSDVVAPPALHLLADFAVVDRDGTPVRGARLSNEKVEEAGVTDAAGRVRLEFPDSSGFQYPFRMRVSAPPFSPAVTPDFVPSADAPPLVTTVLGPTHRVSGHVFFGDGKPATDATVSVGNGALPVGRVFLKMRDIACGGEPRPARGPVEVYASAPVAPDGSFVVDGLPEGPYHVQAWRDVRGEDPDGDPEARERWYEPPSPSDPSIATNVATDATGIVLTAPNDKPVPLPVRLEGSVTDAETGRPIVVFTASLQGDRVDLTAVRAVAGRFAFSSVDPGTYRLRVWASGHVEFDSMLAVDSETAAQPLAIRLGSGATVKGVVHAPEGVDPTNAIVELRTIEGDRWGGSATVAHDGSYRITGVPAGRYVARIATWNLYASGAKLAPARVTRLDVSDAAAEHGLDLSLALAGRVSLHADSKSSDYSGRFVVRDASGDVVASWPPSSAREHGWFGSFDLPLGRYTFRYERDGAEPIEASFELDGTERYEKQVTLELP
jgi:hypothetical protein